jgi:protocatechuate 3,4-dioxygenase beta subunit
MTCLMGFDTNDRKRIKSFYRYNHSTLEDQMHRYVLASITLAMFFLFPFRGAYGQTESRLTGTVTDSSGAAVVGAQVTATNSATGVAHRALSNETGTYVFPSLPPGPYTVSAQMSGFKGFEHGGVTLDTGFVRTVDIKMEVGQSDTPREAGGLMGWAASKAVGLRV